MLPFPFDFYWLLHSLQECKCIEARVPGVAGFINRNPASEYKSENRVTVLGLLSFLASFLDNPPCLVSPSQVSVAFFSLYPEPFLLPSPNSSLHHCLFSSLRQGKRTQLLWRQRWPVRLLGPQAEKVLEFSGILASLAPRSPFPLPAQTTGRNKKPSRHRPGWTRFRSLITTRKLKKGNNCF